MTTSLYVPGKLTDVENVLVDIGTGYYVKKVGIHVAKAPLFIPRFRQPRKLINTTRARLIT